MLKQFCSLAIAVALVCALAPSADACQTWPYNQPGNHFIPNFRGQLISDFGDYGLIFEDAKTPECSGGAWNPKQGAYGALTIKINETGWHYDALGRWVGPFQGFLEGNEVALIFAAALMIGGNGDLDTPLDCKLNYVRSWYAYNPGPGCGWGTSGWGVGGDTCMEEHAAAAAGYAWIAAYENKRYGYVAAQQHASYAKAHIDAALSTADSICIYDPTLPVDVNGRGPCNVDISALPVEERFAKMSELFTPDAQGMTRGFMLPFNRAENMVYGAGQLTVVGAALIGLEEAGWPKNLDDVQQYTVWALLDEAQRKSASSGLYFKGGTDDPSGAGTCAEVNSSGSLIGDGHGCADGLARPKIFNLNSRATIGNGGYSSIMERYVGMFTPRTTVVDQRVLGSQSTTQSAYPFNEFNDAYFSPFADDQANNPGRKVMYKHLGWSWFMSQPGRDLNVEWHPTSDLRPRLWGYLDDNDPIGWLNGITDYGSLGAAVYGWACDRDRPDAQIGVKIYADVNGTLYEVGTGTAYYDSEPAVNSECGGGTAHRYAIAIPAWTKGYQISAYGVDATFRGLAIEPAYNCNMLYSCKW